MSSLADEIERFRVAALRPVAWEMNLIDRVTNVLQNIEEARRYGAQDMAAFFAHPNYELPEAQLSESPNLAGPWPEPEPVPYPPGHPAGLGPPQQRYAPPPPPGYINGNHPPAPPVHEAPWSDILNKAQAPNGRPR